jgi:hypothetical protein
VNRCSTALLSSTLASMAMLLVSCGSSSNAPSPQPTVQSKSAMVAKPDVTITVDGAQHVCVVALAGEPHGNSIPCAELIPFMRDELRVPSGAVYDLRATPTVDEAEVLKVRTSLKDAGYASAP